MIKRISLVTILFLLAVSVWGQNETSRNYSIDMFPKTPDATSLGKFIDIPPGDYTGVAAFSIPIYTFEVDGLKFPIELSYSTTGVKVSEVASRVGLGWALNAGGVSLSKQVVGIPDQIGGQRPIITDINFDPDSPGNLNDPDFAIAAEVLGLDGFSNPVDIKPDIFSYSLPSGSGKYILDSGGDFGIPIPYNKIEIDPNGFEQIIKDENGNQYNFRDWALDVLNANSCYSGPPTEDANYQISSIKTKNSNDITFSYTKSSNAHFVTSMVEQKRLYYYRTGVNNDPNEDTFPRLLPPKCYNHTYLRERIITEIKFPEGSIHFLYNDDVTPSSSREDLPGDYFLKKVIVKNTNGETIKEVTLHFDSYFESPNSGNFSGEMFRGINKRLKLTRVTDNLTGGEYKLNYYEDNQLPHRLSNSQDFWGVYNGKPNLQTSIPTTVYQRLNVNNDPFRLELGADKYPDITYGVTGNLKRITYPTGGFTQITYEADDFIGNAPPIYKYTTRNVNTNSNQNFSINNHPMDMRIQFTGANDDGTGMSNVANCRLKIYRGSNPTPVYDSNQYGSFNMHDSFEAGNHSLVLTPGLDIETYEPVICTANLSWQEQQLVDDSSYRKTGTIRVQKIESEDVITGKITREFTYLDPTTNYTTTSGLNLGDEYLIAYSTSQYPVNDLGMYITDIVLSNNPGWQMNTERGKSVGYDYVQEIYKSPTESFKKEYKFKNTTDTGYTNHNPYSPINYTWPVNQTTRGLKLYEKMFDQDNKLKQQIEYEYDYDTYFNRFATSYPTGTMLLARGLEINLKSINCVPLGCYYTFNTGLFDIKNYWIKNVRATTTEYDSNENPTIVLKDSMTYSPEYKHTFLSNKITTSSLGESVRTEYYYPPDLTSSYEQSALMNKLVGRNQIASPVITKTFENGTPTSEQRTHYAHFYESSSNPDAGFILPQYVYAKKGEIGTTSQPQDKKITYNRYDVNGNLEQYTLENGTQVSIIWGYNGQYPIAKVEGVPYTTISSIAGTLQGLSNNGTLTANSFNDLRNVTGALVTSYIYKPLVGVAEIISPNGQKETYEYDASNRLMHVKDHQGNILKKIDYHYKN